MQSNVIRPTMPIGISRSVIGNVSALPALRARDAAIAPARPLATGFTNFEQCPNCGNANRPGADEAHFVTPSAFARVRRPQSLGRRLSAE